MELHSSTVGLHAPTLWRAMWGKDQTERSSLVYFSAHRMEVCLRFLSNILAHSYTFPIVGGWGFLRVCVCAQTSRGSESVKYKGCVKSSFSHRLLHSYDEVACLSSFLPGAVSALSYCRWVLTLPISLPSHDAGKSHCEHWIKSMGNFLWSFETV